jgi:hypothetical protein
MYIKLKLTTCNLYLVPGNRYQVTYLKLVLLVPNYRNYDIEAVIQETLVSIPLHTGTLKALQIRH